MFKKILVANRGEIACRIIRACRAMGIETVAVYSTADKNSLHVYLADESVCIGPPSVKKSYLNNEAIMTVAKAQNVDAIHPGYGLLSESSIFAQQCIDNGIVFIGPSPKTIEKMGDKAEARATMIKAGVPVTPGTDVMKDAKEALSQAGKIGFPVMIKASAGGGGKGMRACWNKESFVELFDIARSEAQASFGDDSMYIEKLIENPRHIEVQIIADTHGNVVALGERDCSVQRNNQKIIEESPSVGLPDNVRKAMYKTSVKATKAANYHSAGTIEYLVDKDNNYYFMEMNTRIQVEHPVTEMVTGADIVQEMIRIAAGENLTVTNYDIIDRGHAIECRINAEEPESGFKPSPGTITQTHLPGGNGVRVDTAIYDGYTVTPYYDSLIAKVIVHGRDRREALAKMRTALEEMVIVGVNTNLDFLYSIANDETFQAGAVDTSFVEKFMKGEL